MVGISFNLTKLIYCGVLWNVAEFVRLADLPCLEDLVFLGNPLQEKHSTEGNWIDEASKRLPNLKKIDGESIEHTHFKNS